jgi:hypothetical protein
LVHRHTSRCHRVSLCGPRLTKRAIHHRQGEAPVRPHPPPFPKIAKFLIRPLRTVPKRACSPLLTTSGAESLPYSRSRSLPSTHQNVYGPQSQLSIALRTSDGPPSSRTTRPHVRFVLPKGREDGYAPCVVGVDYGMALDRYNSPLSSEAR